MKTLKQIFTLLVILSLAVVISTAGLAASAEKAPSGKDSVKESKAANKKDDRVNINTADADDLQKLPRIGPKMAQRIIEYRKENGKFKRIEEIMKVRGIGEKTFKGFEKMIKI